MSETSKAMIRRLFDECLNGHKSDIYDEFYSDVVCRAPVMGDLRGNEHRQFLISILIGFPDARWTIEDQIAENDKVVTRWTFTGSHSATFLGIEASHKELHLAGLCVDRIAGGKIVEEWQEWDTLGMMQQLGALPLEQSIGDMVAP